MNGEGATELLLIRHAPAIHGGRLCGRTDVPADCSDEAAFAAIRRTLPHPECLIVSPALRCRQTAAALWPDRMADTLRAELWEQDFGDWDGQPYDALPDIGVLPPAEIAAHRPPNGESFEDLVARVVPALTDLADTGGRTVIVAHAGTVRAALSLALGAVPAALAFEIAPLSQTCLRRHPDRSWSVGWVNRVIG